MDGGLTLRIAATWDGRTALEVEQVGLRVGFDADSLVIEVDAPFHGDPPPPGPPGHADGLWEHEVVELFVAGRPSTSGAPRYTEIELGPHGHYLVLRLRGVRQVVERGLPLAYAVERRGERWAGRAVLPRAFLPPGPWTGNAYAIHGVGPERRYLAWQVVPGAQPDFHQPDRFVPLGLSAG